MRGFCFALQPYCGESEKARKEGVMELKAFFQRHPKVALGFSGGVDSAYLLYAAKQYGADVSAYFIESQFQPEFEKEDAKQLAEQLGVRLRSVPCDVLAAEEIAANPADRCYHCKRKLFGSLFAAAKEDGYEVIVDGTNASDLAEERPGMRALNEMEVLSPLRLCGITKEQVRELSYAAGLFTWNKPAYACLATRVPAGERITEELLARVEGAECELAAMGFSDFRVRVFNGAARLQLADEQFAKAVGCRRQIREKLRPYFDAVLLDLEGR